MGWSLRWRDRGRHYCQTKLGLFSGNAPSQKQVRSEYTTEYTTSAETHIISAHKPPGDNGCFVTARNQPQSYNQADLDQEGTMSVTRLSLPRILAFAWIVLFHHP